MTAQTRARVLAMLGGLAALSGLSLLTAAPAHAHAGGGAEPSNYRVRVNGGSSPVPGLTVQVGTGGQWVRLTARGDASITVLGYAGEPFLRITRERVQVNRYATTLSENPRLSTAPTPRTPQPEADPRWVRAGSGPSVAWADTRLSGNDGNRAGARTGMDTWRLPLRVSGAAVEITGTRTWVAPPSPWPWLGAMAAVALATAAVGWLRRWRPVTIALLTLAGAANVVHLVGAASSAQPGSALSAWGPALGVGVLCWPLLAVAVAASWRRSEHAGVATAIAATVLAIFTAGDLPVLWHSQLPFAWPAVTERLLVAATLGAAGGLVIAGLRRLRAETATALEREPEFQRGGDA